MKEQALRYLNKNPLLHVSMTEPIHRGQAEILKADAQGVLLKIRTEDILMLSADTPEKGMALLSDLTEIPTIIVHQESLIEPVMQTYNKAGTTVCYQAVYTGKEPFAIPDDADIRLLDERYCQTMADHYHLSDDPEYMRQLVNLGVMHGIFVENELAGFIGMHTEGSMGLLEIFPKYQNRGLATVLQKYMINFILQKGWVPFGQVIVGNEASMGLQRKLDMEFADGKVTWIYGQADTVENDCPQAEEK